MNGSSFECTDEGTFYVVKSEDGEDKRFQFASKIDVKAALRNHESEDWSQLIEITDPDGKVHQFIMPRSLLAGDASAVLSELLSRGARIIQTTAAKKYLLEYLQTVPAERRRCTRQIGWNDGGQTFVFPDRSFQPHGVDPVYFLKDATGDHYFNMQGTLDEWKENVALHCAQSSRQVFSLAVAFTAPLLEPLNEESFGVNLYGSSSKGKSTAQLAAGSAFGGGTGNEKYIRSWRATANGLESIASLHNSTPLILDEMGQIDPREVGEISYMLSNETGKTRATKTGGTKKTLRWKLTCLSSGEIRISEHMQSAGKRAKTGQEIRMLDVPMAPLKQNTIDVFSDDPMRGAAIADKIRSGAKAFYGRPGRTYVESLVSRKDELIPLVRDLIKRFCDEVSIESSQIARVVKKFGLIAAAGELAIDLGILPFEKETCFKAAQICFEDWRAGWGTGDREVTSVLEQIKDFLNMHGESRFVKIKDKRRTDDRDYVSNKVGYREVSSAIDCSDRVDYWWITTTGFKEIAKGHDQRTTIKALIERGLLIPGKDTPTQQRKDPLTKENQRFYILRADVVGGENVDQ